MPTADKPKRKRASKSVELPILPLTQMTKPQLVAFGEQGERQRVQAGLEMFRRAHKRIHADD